MYYGKQLSRIARLLLYENRDQAACPFMQNAAVQKIFCTELDTYVTNTVATCVNDVVAVYATCTYEIQCPS